MSSSVYCSIYCANGINAYDKNNSNNIYVLCFAKIPPTAEAESSSSPSLKGFVHRDLFPVHCCCSWQRPADGTDFLQTTHHFKRLCGVYCFKQRSCVPLKLYLQKSTYLCIFLRPHPT